MVKRTRRDNRMKKYLKMPMLVLVICILLVSAFSGCKNQTGQNGQDAIKCAVMSRFDKQNTVYYQLAQQIEDYISGDRTIEEAKFSSFCLGINCFIRDEQKTSWENLYPEDVSETITDLMGTTAKNEMETLRLSVLSDNALEQLMVNFYDLSDCCDRTQKNSFAYCVETQDFASDLYREEQNRIKELLMAVSEISKMKGENK